MARITLVLILSFYFSTNCSSQIISGIILNEYNRPLPGATVQLLNSNKTTITGKAGEFTLSGLNPGDAAISVSHLGYAPVIKHIVVHTGNQELTISMKRSYQQIGEVMVSVHKKDELKNDIPISITSLNEKQITDFRIWETNDLTAVSPNLYMADPGDKRVVTSIRGIVSNGYEPAVATYVDGVNQFGLDTYIAQLFDVERIEIARGPQGNLYGRNAMGGVINIITKKPATTTSGFIEASIGNYSSQRISGSIKTTLVKNRLFVGISGLFEHLNGYYNNIYNNTDYDDQHSISGSYYLQYQGRKNFDMVLNVKNISNRNKGAFPLIFGKEEALANPYIINQDAITNMIDDILNVSLSAYYRLKNIGFTSHTAYQTNHRYHEGPIDADFSPLDGMSIYNNYGQDWNNVKVFTHDMKIMSHKRPSAKLNWLAGIYLFSQHNPVKQATLFGEDAMLLGMPDNNFSTINTTRSRTTGIAIYGESNFKFGSMTITAGIRYDHEKRKQSILGEYQKDPDPDPAFAFRPDTSAVAIYSAISPRLGITVKPSENLTSYLMYSKGFRPGGLTSLSADPSQPALFSYLPEHSHNIEAGTKHTFFNNRLALNIAVFYSTITDVQVPTLVLPEAMTIIKNTGRLVSKGFETELQSAFRGFEFLYSFGFTRATYRELKIAQSGEEVNLEGKSQVFSPEITSFLGLQYNIVPRQNRDLQFLVRGEWRYLGTHYFDLANTLFQSPYHLLNAKAGITHKNISLMLWGRNVTDTRYISYGYDFGAVHLGAPAQYGATVGFAF